jgi:hypothetical protein
MSWRRKIAVRAVFFSVAIIVLVGYVSIEFPSQLRWAWGRQVLDAKLAEGTLSVSISGPWKSFHRFEGLQWQVDAPAWSLRWMPSYRRIGKFTFVTVPLWVFFVAGIVGMVKLCCSDRRSGGNACLGCGYDLQGNVSGRCPECGRATKNLENGNCDIGV